MPPLSACNILEAASAHVTSSIPDVLPVTVAVADPERILIGISIQREYPLTMIERRYGIPFGHIKNAPGKFISDAEVLHAYKTNIDAHEAAFTLDAVIEEFLRTGVRHQSTQVVIAFSSGLGNVLQNPRSIAYLNRSLLTVLGEQYFEPPPYTCLVKYASGQPGTQRSIGLELLLFDQLGGVHRVAKEDYMRDQSAAIKGAQPEFEDNILWAVSGYPLVLSGERVSLQMTATSVSDYRHVWRLPRLQESLVKHLAQVSELDQAPQKIEFYFGFEDITEPHHFVPATRGQAVTLPTDITVSDEWIQNVCNACAIHEDLLRGVALFDSRTSQVRLNPAELAKDFSDAGYVARSTPADVREPGDFFIDSARGEITLLLLPAVYPEHIVGVAEGGEVANITIAGQSGRSGITIEDAKTLCEQIGLKDALILDNGNDVVARFGGGAIICHERNNRQTRLTGALHFGYLHEADTHTGSFEGFSVAFTTFRVRPPSPPRSPS